MKIKVHSAFVNLRYNIECVEHVCMWKVKRMYVLNRIFYKDMAPLVAHKSLLSGLIILTAIPVCAPSTEIGSSVTYITCD